MIIHKPSRGSRDVPTKIWARSVQLNLCVTLFIENLISLLIYAYNQGTNATLQGKLFQSTKFKRVSLNKTSEFPFGGLNIL